MPKLLKVAIISCSTLATFIAKPVAINAARNPLFHDRVTMHTFYEKKEKEDADGDNEAKRGKKRADEAKDKEQKQTEDEEKDTRLLSVIINETHENPRYLPGFILPDNVFAEPHLSVAVEDADLLIFSFHVQSLDNVISLLQNKIKAKSCGISLIKGFAPKIGGGVELISDVITRELGIPCCALTVANLTARIIKNEFCRAVIGYNDKKEAQVWKELFHTNNFHVQIVDDVVGVQLCGILKNIVACGAGVVDGLDEDMNVKSALIDCGIREMKRFADVFFPETKLATFYKSCGIEDLVTACNGGRNRRLLEAYVHSKKTLVELESKLRKQNKLRGLEVTEQAMEMIMEKRVERDFPLFVTIHEICFRELDPMKLIECIKTYPENDEEDQGKAPREQQHRYNLRAR